MKIVTLIPSATEIVAFLGQKKSIIGRSHECDFPEDLSKIIKLTEPKINVEGTSGEIHKQIEVILEKSLSVYKVHVDELKKLNPDIRILGSDYKNKNFTGNDLNIKIYYHTRNHNFSSTNLRHKIIEEYNE